MVHYPESIITIIKTQNKSSEIIVLSNRPKFLIVLLFLTPRQAGLHSELLVYQKPRSNRRGSPHVDPMVGRSVDQHTVTPDYPGWDRSLLPKCNSVTCVAELGTWGPSSV